MLHIGDITTYSTININSQNEQQFPTSKNHYFLVNNNFIHIGYIQNGYQITILNCSSNDTTKKIVVDSVRLVPVEKIIDNVPVTVYIPVIEEMEIDVSGQDSIGVIFSQPIILLNPSCLMPELTSTTVLTKLTLVCLNGILREI